MDTDFLIVTTEHMLIITSHKPLTLFTALLLLLSSHKCQTIESVTVTTSKRFMKLLLPCTSCKRCCTGCMGWACAHMQAQAMFLWQSTFIMHWLRESLACLARVAAFRLSSKVRYITLYRLMQLSLRTGKGVACTGLSWLVNQVK